MLDVGTDRASGHGPARSTEPIKREINVTGLHPHAAYPWCAALACVLLAVWSVPLRAMDSIEVKRLFANPPREYSSAPFWVWNDQMTDENVVATLRDFAGADIRQVFVHPRPGLMTPYLGDEWFRLWEVALAEAERLDMNLWIYDENSYPSGFAGGLVPDAMPDARGRGLVLREEKGSPTVGGQTIGVYRLSDLGVRLVDVLLLAQGNTAVSPGPRGDRDDCRVQKGRHGPGSLSARRCQAGGPARAWATGAGTSAPRSPPWRATSRTSELLIAARVGLASR